VRLVRRARRQNISGDDVAAFVMAQPEDEQLAAWERGFLRSLVTPGFGIDLAEGGGYFVNGRHRTQGMIDAGVRRTVVPGWRRPDA
jgi:hypothetical protein